MALDEKALSEPVSRPAASKYTPMAHPQVAHGNPHHSTEVTTNGATSAYEHRTCPNLKPRNFRLTIAKTILVLLLADAVRLWAGKSTSCGLNRQTPVTWRRRNLLGVFGWGLDTGVPITTIRSSSLPALGIILTLTGFGSRWGGLFYASGLSIGLLVPLIGGRRLGLAGRVARLDRGARLLARPVCLLGPTAAVFAVCAGTIYLV